LIVDHFFFQREEDIVSKNSQMYHPGEFFAKLARDELAPRLVLTGLIKKEGSDESHALFAIGT